MGVTTSQPRPPAYKWLGTAPKWLYTKTNHAPTDETVQRASATRGAGAHMFVWRPTLLTNDVGVYARSMCAVGQGLMFRDT
eukprot:9062602-Heterocapsa_arctica.AAC.1